MIYLVSNQKQLFPNNIYKESTIEDAIHIINSWEVIQFDTETTGRNPRICDLLCYQFGNKEANIQFVVDATTIDILKFKNILESKLLIGHNLKFDLQFLYKYGIIPTKVWDTMIVEQLLHLGFDPKNIHYSLKAVAERRLGIDIDKTVRGEIIWRGLDSETIKYAAGDVIYLEDIKEQQEKELKYTKSIKAGEIENAFVPVIAYLEWCGIKLDVNKWKKKMQENESAKIDSLNKLDKYVVSLYEKDNKKFLPFIEQQLDLFSTEIKSNINWSSSKQVIPFVQILGFSTQSEDKKTGKSKDSVVEKLLAKQKGIDDKFLELYFNYQEATKVCSTYGQNYLDAINPITGRIHTTFKQLGAASGRMSCGNGHANDTDLAKLKHISPERCKYVQIQNLPSDELTRSCFISEDDNYMCSCDFSALESRLGADIYNEPHMIDEFINGSGDIHSLMALTFFEKQMEPGTTTKDIKKKYPDLRKKAKSPEFLIQFGGSAKGLSTQLAIPKKEAQEYVDSYYNKFKGIAAFKTKSANFLANHGYIIICKKTGHKVYWENYHKWRELMETPIELRDREYSSDDLKILNMEYSKWSNRMTLNAPTQGSGIIILKIAMILFFKWIIKNNLFNKVLVCDLVHDEAVIEYPKTIPETANILKSFMEKASSLICTRLPIPAVPEISDHWVH